MNNNGEHIIRQTNFLGFEFYKRTRLEEYEIQINAQQNITEYPGLLAISNKPEIKYSSLSSGSTNWDITTYRSIELTLLDLIINEFVELTIFTDKKSYANELINFKRINYYLMVKKIYVGNDHLASRIIWSVKYLEKERNEKATLSNIIRHLIDGFIGSDRYRHPQKEFLEILLRTYGANLNWLTVQSHSQFLGMYSRHEIIIEQKQKVKLMAAYRALQDILTTLKQESNTFNLYSNKFYKIIKSDFHRRQSKG